ncbi:MAG: IclR family transcriptional regulator [Candidatus Bipolaricaulota bacterium]|nr:IclR family transcriptional regulator [Candidatus Bipolaricaulota bacterium]
MNRQSNEADKPLVRSLDKALKVLELLAQLGEEVDLGDLANQAGLPKSTLVRLLRTLQLHNFVQQDPNTRRYRLGWGLIHLGKAAERQFSLALVVHPFLEQLVQETGETASVAILDGNHAVYLDQVTSRSIIRGVPPVGSKLGLHCTAVGKVLLSAFSEGQLDRLVGMHGLPRLTENTIVNATRLRKELARTRKLGYAIDDEEAEPGGRCIAAPIKYGDETIKAAVSITGPANRICIDCIEDYAQIVCRVAEQISGALSSKPPQKTLKATGADYE